MQHAKKYNSLLRRTWFAAAVLLLASVQSMAAVGKTQVSAPGYRTIAGGTIPTLLPPDGKQAPVTVARFSMRVRPVSQAEFAQFVQKVPRWRKSTVAGGTLADAQYLQRWPTDTSPSKAQITQPATDVSWFAAVAYCESEGARLPTWHEWEYAAAADAKRRDARADPFWRSRILDWYGQTSTTLPSVGSTQKNIYGIQDLHGVIWEWVDDFGALMVSGDNRTQGDPDTLKFCGAGALSATDRENYPVLMRIAMLSSLSASSTNRNLGFRCVKTTSESKP
jgi:formylglycine-generating enzyme